MVHFYIPNTEGDKLIWLISRYFPWLGFMKPAWNVYFIYSDILHLLHNIVYFLACMYTHCHQRQRISRNWWNNHKVGTIEGVKKDKKTKRQKDKRQKDKKTKRQKDKKTISYLLRLFSSVFEVTSTSCKTRVPVEVPSCVYWEKKLCNEVDLRLNDRKTFCNLVAVNLRLNVFYSWVYWEPVFRIILMRIRIRGSAGWWIRIRVRFCIKFQFFSS